VKVLLVDADSKEGFPNLALMKISAHHKRLGREVDLIRGLPDAPPLNHYDQVWLSCIYFQNEDKARDYLGQFPKETDILFGGSGFQKVMNVRLGKEIEHLMPDYSLYDVDFSMGFTSRGCIRKCPWCVVPEKEGKIRNHAPIAEFLEPDHTKIILLDNNFTQSPKRYENLRFIQDHNLEVNFNQGLDFRGLSYKFVRLLAEIKFTTWKFNYRRVSFAFDTMKAEPHVIKGVNLLRKVGISRGQIMIYILVGFNTTIEQDLRRVQLVRDLDADPYIMRYNQNRGRDDILMHLSRWVNWRIYRNVDFADYDYCGSKESYKSVFGTSPDPTWGGYGCPQGSYAWANRQEQEDDGQQTLEKEKRA